MKAYILIMLPPSPHLIFQDDTVLPFRVNSNSSTYPLHQPRDSCFPGSQCISLSTQNTSNHILSSSILFPPLEILLPICYSVSLPSKFLQKITPSSSMYIFSSSIIGLIFLSSFPSPPYLQTYIFKSVGSFKKILTLKPITLSRLKSVGPQLKQEWGYEKPAH